MGLLWYLPAPLFLELVGALIVCLGLVAMGLGFSDTFCFAADHSSTSCLVLFHHNPCFTILTASSAETTSALTPYSLSPILVATAFLSPHCTPGLYASNFSCTSSFLSLLSPLATLIKTATDLRFVIQVLHILSASKTAIVL